MATFSSFNVLRRTIVQDFSRIHNILIPLKVEALATLNVLELSFVMEAVSVQ